jgi:hypothetical protein
MTRIRIQGLEVSGKVYRIPVPIWIEYFEQHRDGQWHARLTTDRDRALVFSTQNVTFEWEHAAALIEPTFYIEMDHAA